MGNFPFGKITIAVNLVNGEMSAFTHKMIEGAKVPYTFKVEGIQNNFEYWLFDAKSFLDIIWEARFDHIKSCDRCRINEQNEKMF